MYLVKRKLFIIFITYHLNIAYFLSIIKSLKDGDGRTCLKLKRTVATPQFCHATKYLWCLINISHSKCLLHFTSSVLFPLATKEARAAARKRDSYSKWGKERGRERNKERDRQKQGEKGSRYCLVSRKAKATRFSVSSLFWHV